MIQIPGVLLNIYQCGVLLMGKSGVGKSELALSLIRQGHILVADDVVAIEKVDTQTLQGSCPAYLQDFLHIRDVGVINVRHIFGEHVLQSSSQINFIIKLLEVNSQPAYDPLTGIKATTETLLDISVPVYNLVARPGRNLAVLVEVVTRNYQLAGQGYQAVQEIQNRELLN